MSNPGHEPISQAQLVSEVGQFFEAYAREQSYVSWKASLFAPQVLTTLCKTLPISDLEETKQWREVISSTDPTTPELRKMGRDAIAELSEKVSSGVTDDWPISRKTLATLALTVCEDRFLEVEDKMKRILDPESK